MKEKGAYQRTND